MQEEFYNFMVEQAPSLFEGTSFGEFQSQVSSYEGAQEFYQFMKGSEEGAKLLEGVGFNEFVQNMGTSAPAIPDEQVLIGSEDFAQTEIGNFVNDVARAGLRGWQSGSVRNEGLELAMRGSNIQEESLNNIIAAQESQQKYRMSDEFLAFQNAEGTKASMDAFLKAPLTIITEAITESVGAMVAAGGPILTGAAAAGPGAVVTVPVAAALTSGSLEVSGEMIQSVQQAMEEDGLAFTTENMRVWLGENPENLRKIREKALKRGLTVGVVDGVTAGIAGKIGGGKLVSKVIPGKNKVSKAARGLVEEGSEVLTEAIGGASGEAAAQMATGDDADWKAIFLEGISEVGSGGGMMMTSKLTKKGKGFLASKEMLPMQIIRNKVRGGEDVNNSDIVDLVAGRPLEEVHAEVKRLVDLGQLDPQTGQQITQATTQVKQTEQSIPTEVQDTEVRGEITKQLQLRNESQQQLQQVQSNQEARQQVEDVAFQDADVANLQSQQQQLQQDIQDRNETARALAKQEDVFVVNNSRIVDSENGPTLARGITDQGVDLERINVQIGNPKTRTRLASEVQNRPDSQFRFALDQPTYTGIMNNIATRLENAGATVNVQETVRDVVRRVPKADIKPLIDKINQGVELTDGEQLIALGIDQSQLESTTSTQTSTQPTTSNQFSPEVYDIQMDQVATNLSPDAQLTTNNQIQPTSANIRANTDIEIRPLTEPSTPVQVRGRPAQLVEMYQDGQKVGTNALFLNDRGQIESVLNLDTGIRGVTIEDVQNKMTETTDSEQTNTTEAERKGPPPPTEEVIDRVPDSDPDKPIKIANANVAARLEEIGFKPPEGTPSRTVEDMYQESLIHYNTGLSDVRLDPENDKGGLAGIPSLIAKAFDGGLLTASEQIAMRMAMKDAVTQWEANQAILDDTKPANRGELQATQDQLQELINDIATGLRMTGSEIARALGIRGKLLNKFAMTAQDMDANMEGDVANQVNKDYRLDPEERKKNKKLADDMEASQKQLDKLLEQKDVQGADLQRKQAEYVVANMQAINTKRSLLKRLGLKRDQGIRGVYGVERSENLSQARDQLIKLLTKGSC